MMMIEMGRRKDWEERMDEERKERRIGKGRDGRERREEKRRGMEEEKSIR